MTEQIIHQRRVAVYVRVSTIDQSKHGYSILEQRERLTKYCEAHEWTIVKIYEDPGFSGAYLDRPGIQQLIRDTDLGTFDTVLVWKLDRLSRSQKNTMFLIEDVFLKRNISFISMSENFDTNTPFGRAMVGILSVFAQLDRDQITQRLTMGRIGRAKAGYYSGGRIPPIGYKYGQPDASGKRTLKVDQYEAMQVQMIFDLWLHGMDGHDMTLMNILNYMREHYTTEQRAWTEKGHISRILRNQIYIGKVSFQGKWYDGIHEPIISEETFKAAGEKYDRYIKKFSRTIQNFKGSYLLTGLLRCGICGKRYFGMSVRNKHVTSSEKPYYRYYVCYTRKKVNPKVAADMQCDSLVYKTDELEDIVLGEVAKLHDNPSRIQHIEPRPDPSAGIKQRLKEIKKQISKLIDLYQLGTISMEDIQSRTEMLSKEREKLEAELNEKKTVDPAVKEQAFRSALADFDPVSFRRLSMEQQRSVLRSLIDEIIIYNDRIEIHWAFH